MQKPIKVSSCEITFPDGEARTFSSIEQLMVVVFGEHDVRGLADSVWLQGVDDDGKVYRLALDVRSLQCRDNDPEFSLSFEKAQSQKLLGELLVSSGIITETQLREAVDEQGKLGFKEKLGEVLIRTGVCTPNQIVAALCKQVGLSLK